MEHIIKPIAYIETDFKEKFGIPRQSGRCMSLSAKIVFEPQYRNPDMIRGMEDFSHLWLIFGFNRAFSDNINATVRPPRLGGNKRVGVFATRSPFRPNGLGLSSVKIAKIENGEIYVNGADLLDGTPIYDIKPYLARCDSHADAVGGFSDEKWDYKLKVDISDELKNIIPTEKTEGLIQCLADDPRPAYHNDDRSYNLKFDKYDVHFKVCNDTVLVFAIDKL